MWKHLQPNCWRRLPGTFDSVAGRHPAAGRVKRLAVIAGLLVSTVAMGLVVASTARGGVGDCAAQGSCH